MAIKIIKHGKETFKVVCPICGCEFTYQAEDLKEDCFGNHFVKCPDCKQAVSHEYEAKKKGLQKDITFPNYPNDIWINTGGLTNYQDCATCPNKPDPNKIVVGDTPCTWCKKSMPMCNRE